MQNLKKTFLFIGVLILFCVYIPQALAVAPTATNLSAAETYTEDTTLNLIDIVVSDSDSPSTTATLTLSNPSAGSLTTGTSGAVTSTFSSGVWTATGAIADVNVLLASVSFVPALNFNASFTITTSATDGVGTVSGSKAMTGVAVNDAPTATNLSAAESYTEDTSLNLIDIVASDVDSASVTATLTLSNTSAGSLTTATSGAVTSTFSSGVWTASGAIANVNTLLAGVTFVPTANFNASFTISTSVSDGIAAAITGSKAMTGTAVNDAPVLDTSKSPALNSVIQNAGAPTGAVGTLVSALVDFATPTGQVDNITDVDSGASLGIAIVATDTVNLNCYYSLNGGASWTAVGAVSGAAARLLAADADNRVYCYNGASYTGTLSSALTIRAWDVTTGSDGGTADTTTNGGTTAFSTATDTVSLTVVSGGAAPTGFSSGNFSDINADGTVDRVTVVVNNAPLTTCDVSNTELATDWTYAGSSLGGSIASASCNASTGTITFVLSSGSSNVTSGTPTIAYNDTDGDHSIANAGGNLGTVSAFSLSDAAAPVLQEATPVSTPTNNTTPSYAFFSTEAGTLTYAGGCTSATTSATPSAANTIAFSALADGTYGACTIKVTDGSGNQSALLTVTSFTIDTVPPVVSGFGAGFSGGALNASWTTNEAASTLLYYSANGQAGGNSGLADTSPRTTSHAVSVSGLQLCSSYSVQAQSIDAAGNTSFSNSVLVSGQSCGLALPAMLLYAPVVPPGGFRVSATRTRGVIEVATNAGDDVKAIAISATPDFTNVGQLPYRTKVEWTSTTPGYVGTASTVYVKFYTGFGQTSVTYSAPVLDSQVLGVTTVVAEAPSPNPITFKTTLSVGNSGPEVKALQQLLAAQPGIYPEGLITGYFGNTTRKAVQRFQLQYGLAEKGKSGFGVVGPATRKQLNALVR